MRGTGYTTQNDVDELRHMQGALQLAMDALINRKDAKEAERVLGILDGTFAELIRAIQVADFDKAKKPGR